MDMTPADRAREAALSVEAKKHALRQQQDGCWIMTLRVHQNDMPEAIMKAAMGTRYMLALVEIGDDEEPVSRAVSQPEKQPGRQDPPSPAGRADKERQKWATMPYAKQVVLRGQQPVFWAFLREMCARDVRSEEQAARAVREICRVASRADIKPDTEAESYWLDLEKFFDAWKTQDQVA